MTGIERLRDIVNDGPYSGGMIHISVQKLREICEQIEREFGVETVKADGIAANNRRVELCAALGIDTDTGWSDAMAEMVKRLMPEGMEWPRFEDGEPVRLGEHWEEDGFDESVTRIDSIEFADDGVRFENEYNEVFYRYGERVKRPAPKVLDADGVEIRVGDTVYLLPGEWCDVFPCLGYHGGEELEVFSLHADHVVGGIGCRDTRRPKGACYPRPSQLTHRAPVLAADGEPLREGEHVYHVETGAELVVKKLPKPGEYQAVIVFALPTSPASHLTSFDPDQLTHQRPVLDADGNRIEPGMDVWWVCEGDERGIHAEKLHVDSIGDDGLVTCDPYNGGTWVELEPSELYANKPVLAADGEPLEVGQTVYHIADGKEYTVEELFKDGAMVTHDGITGGRCRAEYLTHERPDSWERLEEHKDLSPFDYCKKVGHKLDTFEDAERFKSRDLVRRAKSLAGDA